MDYDADGRTDILTGSYTGQMYLFRRQADGAFAPRELLLDQAGDTLMVSPPYSIVPELVDMDADGDLDLVIGARSDPVQIVQNVGRRGVPVWSKAIRILQTTNGEAIAGSNAHHADWDGDGVRDLVVGSEWGEVRWYRNVGANDAPRYENAGVLVERSRHERDPEGTTPKRPGMRVKVHVTDWNGDGRADLLVGDVTWQQSNPDPLTEDAVAEKAKLESDLEALRAKLPVQQGPERAALEAALEECRTKLRAILNRIELHTHGWVWLYVRKA